MNVNNQIDMNEALLIAYLDGSLSPEEMAAVESWYDASEENRKLLEQLYFILQLHDCNYAVKDISPEQSLAALKQKIAKRNVEKSKVKRLSFTRQLLRYAAAIVALVAVVAGFATYFYGKNQTCEIVADKRVVYLDGEALFDVAKVAGSEFVVKANGAQIVVKGTKFNFKAYSHNPVIETTLIEGAVDLRTNGQKIAVKPNQKVFYNKETRRMNIVEVDAQLDIFGERYFNTEKLEYVINSLEHIYNCKISFSDYKLKDIRFSGTVNRKNSLEHTLNILTLTTGTTYKRYGDAIVIDK